MLHIGLTGGIGSGKTTIANIFSTLGIPVYDADSVAKNIMQTNKTVRNKVIACFGNDVYRDGLLNRELLASIVFNDPAKLQELNAIIHPAVIQDAEDWFRHHDHASFAIKEAALIFESGSHKQLDYVIGVWAPKSLRIERTIERGGLTKQQVLNRISQQMNEEEKMKKCDFVIDNSGDKPVIPQVFDLHEKLNTISRLTISE
ncbi:MAG TPA: dephospho-CoA kinase [Niabella sp.]|nr:dephospho-CoA kinase [Niabella sp.]HOZ98145.1 dephospho-CoA kinase [Niabella sp.]HQW16172.1 dephospho-CoA kinase [Niabella sp.]HQX21384.1 dephospho-CoA kinase [Niabella sp.]HQX41210.1 dephospho-CoA kinase [Niabella sp.]